LEEGIAFRGRTETQTFVFLDLFFYFIDGDERCRQLIGPGAISHCASDRERRQRSFHTPNWLILNQTCLLMAGAEEKPGEASDQIDEIDVGEFAVRAFGDGIKISDEGEEHGGAG
jgi:hypothetical protein